MTDPIKDLSYWLLLQKAPLIGDKIFYKALSYFESAENVFTSSAQVRQQSGIFKHKTLDWLNQADLNLIKADIDWQAGEDCHILTILDTAYPKQLKVLDIPPPTLYVRGSTCVLSDPQIAIVGSRNPSPSAIECTADFATKLTQSGLTITSGLATGVDAQAHTSALENKGNTIAVCGTGLDKVYPAKHKNLAHQISIQGALVSQFGIGTPPIASNFPKRNQIIAGLSLGTLVTEATLKSGSLITARLAAEQGREVFAIPSSIYNQNAKGCHQLIQQGAILTQDITDILTNINQHLSSKAEISNVKNTQQKVTITPNILLKYLTYTPQSVDELGQKSGLSVAAISQELLALELSGSVQNMHQMGFALK